MADNQEMEVQENMPVRDIIREIENRQDGAVVRFESASDPSVSIEFANVVDDMDMSTYCEVTAHADGDSRILYSRDEDGRTLGSEKGVENFVNENMADGYVSRSDVSLDNEDTYNDVTYETEDAPTNAFAQAFEEIDLQNQEIEEVPFERSEEFEAQGMTAFVDNSEPPNVPIEILMRGDADDIKVVKPREEREPNVDIRQSSAFLGSLEDSPVLKSVATGFIPFELREGFIEGNENVLTQEDVALARKEFDPEFGKILGIDTTRFVPKSTDTEKQNVSIIRLEYKDIEPIVCSEGVENSGFSEDKVIPDSVRVYKEFGDTMKVDGVRFGVTNLATIELRQKGELEPYRKTVILDDSGVVRGELHCGNVDKSIPLTLNLDGRDKIEKLDRTDVNNKGHFKMFEGKGATFREVFLGKVEKELPSFYEKLFEKVCTSLDERKEMLQDRIENSKEDKAALRGVMNRVELYREYQGAQLVVMEEKIQEIGGRLDVAVKERDATPVDDERYKELSDKVDSIKQEFAENFHDYVRMTKEVEPEANIVAINDIYKVYDDVSLTEQKQEFSFREYFGGKTDDGMGNYRTTSFYDGIIDDKPASVEMRFQHLIHLEDSRIDCYPPTNAAGDTIQIFSDYVKDVDAGLEKMVETYNDSVDNDAEKIYIGEDKQLYTSSGFQIEAKILPAARATAGFPKDGIEKTYNKDMDKETHVLTAENQDKIPLYAGPNQDIDYQSVEAYSKYAPEGMEKTRAEIKQDIESKFICKGISDNRLKWLGTKDPVDRMEERTTKIFNTDLKNELKAMCVCIEENFADSEKLDYDALQEDIEQYEVDSADEDELDIAEDESVDTPQNEGLNKDSIEKMIGRSHSGSYGKINTKDKEVAISKDKMSQIEKEADVEARQFAAGTGEKAEEIYELKKAELIDKKVEEVKAELNVIKKDLEHYNKVMEKMELPFRIRSSHTGFQAAKAEFDGAIKKYAEVGGAIGKEEFVTKGVTKLESYLGFSDLWNSRTYETIVYNALRGDMKDHFDIYKEGNFEANKYSKLAGFGRVVTTPFNAVGRVLFGLPAKFLSELSDVDRSPADISKDNDNVEKKEKPEEKVEREQSDTDKVDDTEKPDVETNEDDVETKEADTEKDEMDDTEKEEGSDIEENEDIEETKKDTDVQDTEQPDVQDAEQPDVQDTEQPEEQDVEAENEDTEASEKEDIETSETDSADNEENQDIEKNEDDSEDTEDTVETPENKDSEVPEDEDVEVPEDEDVEKDIEDLEASKEDSDEDAPEDVGVSEEEDMEAPEDEDVETPEGEDVEEPEGEDVEAPEKEDTEEPEDKDVEAPEDDDTETPEEDETDDVEKPEDDTGVPEVDKAQDETDKDVAVADGQPEVDTDEQGRDDTDAAREDDNSPDVEENGQPDQASEVDTSDVEKKADDDVSDVVSAGTDVEPEKEETEEDPVEQAQEEIEVEDPAFMTDYHPEDTEGDELDAMDMADLVDQNEGAETSYEVEYPATQEEVAATINNVLDGSEELDVALSQIGDALVDGALTQEDVMDAVSSAIADNVVDGTMPEGAADLVYEAMNYIEGSPMDTLDTILNSLLDAGVDSGLVQGLEQGVADAYEYAEPFEQNSMGELDNITFDDYGAYDSYYGDSVPEDYAQQMDFGTDAVDYDVSNYNDVFAEQNGAAMDVANDIYEHLSDLGYDDNVAHDVAMDSLDQMTNDFSNPDVDWGSEDYQDSLIQDAEQIANDLSQMADTGTEDVEYPEYDYDYTDNSQYQQDYQPDDTYDTHDYVDTTPH